MSGAYTWRKSWNFMQLPQSLIGDLRAAGLAVGELFSAESAPAEIPVRIPSGPGAYLLLIGLARPVVLDIPRFSGLTVAPGWYAYAGNANGPGGLRARVARHLRQDMRQDKRPHWHVDHLTSAASVAALCFPAGDECRLVGALMLATDFAVPVPGFGSTDCRRCKSHLVRWTKFEQSGIQRSR